MITHKLQETVGWRVARPDEWLGRWLGLWTIALGRIYVLGLVLWLGLQTFFGDGWWWLFLLNAGATYLFLPLPLLAIIALLLRRRELWLQIGLVLAMWSGLFLPGYLPQPKLLVPVSDGPTLMAASYNLLGSNDNLAGVVATIRELDADVVAIQELSPQIASAIQRDLGTEYPHQILDPQIGVTGAGIISRYRLVDTGQTLPGGWIGRPQIVQLDFDGTPVMVLNFHAYPFTVSPSDVTPGADSIEWTVQAREQQAQAAIDFVAANPGPLLAMTDLNATDQSRAHKQLTQVLQDGWHAAGLGPGHTFPGESGSGDIPLPDWLIRIDYVFHSSDWQAESALVGPWDGVSDHRPVVVALVLSELGVDSTN